MYSAGREGSGVESDPGCGKGAEELRLAAGCEKLTARHLNAAAVGELKDEVGGEVGDAGEGRIEMDIDVVVGPGTEGVKLQRDGLKNWAEREGRGGGLKTDDAGGGTESAAGDAVVIIGFDRVEDGRDGAAIYGVNRGEGAGRFLRSGVALEGASAWLGWLGGTGRGKQCGGVIGEKRGGAGGRGCESAAIEAIGALFGESGCNVAIESAGEVGIFQTRSGDEARASQGLSSQLQIARGGQVSLGWSGLSRVDGWRGDRSWSDDACGCERMGEGQQ